MQLTEKGSTSKVPRQAILLLSLLFFARASIGVIEKLKEESTPDPVPWVTPSAKGEKTFKIDNPEHKPILFEFYSANDENSRVTNAIVLRNVEVAGLITRRFLPVRISDELRDPHGQTPQAIRNLVQRFSIARVPALIITNPEGKELARVEGYKPASIVYQLLSTALAHPHVLGQPTPAEH